MDEAFLRSSSCEAGSRPTPEETLSEETPESGQKGFFHGVNIRDLLGALVGPMLLLPFAIAFVGMVVAANPALKADFPLLLSTVLLSQTLSTFMFVAFSQFSTCTNIDLLSAAFIAKLCTTIRPFVAEQDLFVHVCFGQGVFTIIVGILLCVVAWLDGIWYFRFLPYTVSAGFVTGIGLLILNGGFELGCGHSMQELAMGVGTLPTMVFVHAALAALAAFVFHVVSCVIRNSMRLPVGIVVNTMLFHGVACLAGFTMESLTSWGFLLDGLQPEPWTEGWLELRGRFREFSPLAFLKMPIFSLTASYAALHVISYPFYATAMLEVDETSHDKKISMKKEIATMGAANVIVGCLAGVPVAHSVKALVVMQDAGARSKLWSLLVGIVFTLVYFCTSFRARLVVIPKCTFGGLVALLGFEFVKTSLAESRERIAAAEWRFVLAIAVIIYFDVLTGLAFGLALVMIFFVIEYSGMTGITRQATLKEVRSNVDRPSDEIAVLDSCGDVAALFWLNGYIFFGSAVAIVEEVEEFIESSHSVRHLIIDFEHVPAVDASGVHHFTNFASKCLRRSPPIRVCFSGVVRRLRLAVANAAHSKRLVGLKLDARLAEDAICWAEEEIIAMRRRGRRSIGDGLHRSAGEPAAASVLEVVKLFLRSLASLQPPAALEHVASRLAPAAKLVRVAQGGHLFTEGASAADIFYVAHGAVELARARKADEGCKLPRHHLNAAKGDLFVFEEDNSVRVQLVCAGSVLGTAEYGSAAGSAKAFWYTSAKAVADCQVLKVPFGDFFAALESQPAIGLAIATRLGQLSSAHFLRLTGRSGPGSVPSSSLARAVSRLELPRGGA